MKKLFKQSKSSWISLLLCLALLGCSEKGPNVGEQVVSELCVNCHKLGINGAPIIGNSKMWNPRIEQGTPALIQHAIDGFGLMPAKGGNLELTDDEISAAVTYMIEQLP